MISVSIASGYENDRQIIISLLSEHGDFRITSVGIDGYDALRSAMIHRPNIIIMDFFMNDIDSRDLAPIIKRHSPSTKLIVIYSLAEYSAIIKILGAAISAGISGYLSKENNFENLVPSVRSVFYGGLYVGNRVKYHSMNSINIFELDNQTKKRYHFSPIELQILNGIALGNKDTEIAKQLNITEGALRNNVYRIKKKTGLRTRTQITIYAMSCGMINTRKLREQFNK